MSTEADALVPARASWPEPEPQSAAGAALTDLILTIFRVHDLLQASAQVMAAAGDLTAALWQVLGGVLDEPRTVSEVARRMGMSRQGVQRTVDLLVARGLAEYRSNPAHRRAQLVACTEAGYWAVRRISIVQHPWATAVGGAVGVEPLVACRSILEQLAGTVTDPPARG